jgi:rhamnulokinase
VFAGWVDDTGIRVEELSRFANQPRRAGGALRWEVDELWSAVQAGLEMARARGRGSIRSVGVDAWGVDFALFDRHRKLIAHPRSYRDARTVGMVERVTSRVPADELFATTGNQTLAINTLIQLAAMVIADDPELREADLLVTMPDLFNHWLCGSENVELTSATTTQCFDPTLGSWASDVLSRLGIPERLFPEIVEPGTILGTLDIPGWSDAARATIPVIATASHDTASAVTATPRDPATAFVSSGSWTLVGIERPSPILNSAALRSGLTNERGVDGQTLLLDVVAGMWLLEQSREAWQSLGQPADLDRLLVEAALARPLASLFDPNDPSLLSAIDVPAAIRDLCRSRGEREPEDPAAVARAILESVALRAATSIEAIESVTGQQIGTIRIIGGGSRNRLFCQFLADATGRLVLAGPAEAAVLGNLAVQAHRLGLVDSLDEARRLASMSVELVEYEPHNDERWASATARFAALMVKVQAPKQTEGVRV